MRVFPMQTGRIMRHSARTRSVLFCFSSAPSSSSLSSCQCGGCGRKLLSGAELLQCSRCTAWQRPPTSTSASACFTFYSLFSLALPHFAIDSSVLKQRFVHLQGLVHPDRHIKDADDAAAAWSVFINHAYSTLKDPLQRAIYLANLLEGRSSEGSEAEAERTVSHAAEPSSPELFDISEVLETREAIEAAAVAQDSAALARLKTQNALRISDAMQGLCRAFDHTRPPNLEAARAWIVRLKYWRSIEEAIDDASP